MMFVHHAGVDMIVDMAVIWVRPNKGAKCDMALHLDGYAPILLLLHYVSVQLLRLYGDIR